MKKVILGALCLSTATLLASCDLFRGGDEHSSNGGNNTSVVSKEEGYLAQTVLSLNLLEQLPAIETLSAPSGLQTETSPIEEEMANEILDSMSGLSSLLTFTPQEVEILPSDREEFEKLYQVTLNDFNGEKETYSLYLNEKIYEENDHDEWEKVTILNGIAIKGEEEYQVRGEKSEEKERDEWEQELELTIAKDKLNYVKIEQSLEDDENEYEYELVQNGRLIENKEYEFEQERNGILAISIEREFDGEEREITLYSDGSTLLSAEFEVETRSGKEKEGKIRIIPNDDGSITYELTFKESSKIYTKTF